MTANNTTPQCPDDPVLRDACVPDGRRLCAHADRDGAGMYRSRPARHAAAVMMMMMIAARQRAARGTGRQQPPRAAGANRFGEPPTGFACARCGRQIVTSIAGVPARRAAG